MRRASPIGKATMLGAGEARVTRLLQQDRRRHGPTGMPATKQPTPKRINWRFAKNTQITLTRSASLRDESAEGSCAYLQSRAVAGKTRFIGLRHGRAQTFPLGKSATQNKGSVGAPARNNWKSVSSRLRVGRGPAERGERCRCMLWPGAGPGTAWQHACVWWARICR